MAWSSIARIAALNDDRLALRLVVRPVRGLLEQIRLSGTPLRVGVATALVLLAFVVVASPVLAQDGTEPCRIDCDPEPERDLVDSYASRKRLAELRARLLRQLDRQIIRRDIQRNPLYTDVTKKILQRQIKDGFSDFDSPNPFTPPSPDTVPAEEPFSFIEISMPGPFGGGLTKDCSAPGSCVFPNPYDTKEQFVQLLFVLNTLTVSQVGEYIDLQNPFKYLSVLMNGFELAQGAFSNSPNSDYWVFTTPNCTQVPVGPPPFVFFVDAPCLVISFNKDAWYSVAPPWAAWSIHVELGSQILSGIPPDIILVKTKHHESSATVVPPANLKSYWAATLGLSVSSTGCTMCHSMDTVANILAQTTNHPAGGAQAPMLIQSIVNPSQDVYHCDNCHENFLPNIGQSASSDFDEFIWATPTEAMGIDWAEIINNNPNTWPSIICNKMTTNLPTHADREKHFHEDVRLNWAVAHGNLPLGNLPVDKAPPKNYGLFIQFFDKWNDSGAPCP